MHCLLAIAALPFVHTRQPSNCLALTPLLPPTGCGSGYRAGLSAHQCCASLLQLHNESGNIWSHLLPALLMLALAAGGQLQAWHGAAAAYWANVGR